MLRTCGVDVAEKLRLGFICRMSASSLASPKYKPTSPAAKASRDRCGLTALPRSGRKRDHEPAITIVCGDCSPRLHDEHPENHLRMCDVSVFTERDGGASDGAGLRTLRHLTGEIVEFIPKDRRPRGTRGCEKVAIPVENKGVGHKRDAEHAGCAEERAGAVDKRTLKFRACERLVRLRLYDRGGCVRMVLPE